MPDKESVLSKASEEERVPIGSLIYIQIKKQTKTDIWLLTDCVIYFTFTLIKLSASNKKKKFFLEIRSQMERTDLERRNWLMQLLLLWWQWLGLVMQLLRRRLMLLL